MGFWSTLIKNYNKKKRIGLVILICSSPKRIITYKIAKNSIINGIFYMKLVTSFGLNKNVKPGALLRLYDSALHHREYY